MLDRMESSYAAYANSHYTAVPDGYDDLQAQCETAAKEQKLTDPDDITAYIRTWLNTQLLGDTNASQAPDGTDPIHYFCTSPSPATACSLPRRYADVPHVRPARPLCGRVCCTAKLVHPAGGRQLARRFAGR